MSTFEELMNAYIEYRKGGEVLNVRQRNELWDYVDNYVKGLSAKLFKQRQTPSASASSRERHNLRVMAFYDFIDYAVERGKGTRWILQVFKIRFSNLEGLLVLKQQGVVYVDDVIRNQGILNTVTRRSAKLAAARRNCAKQLRRYSNVSFEDLLPCLVETGASRRVIDNWRNYYVLFQELNALSTPLPLVDWDVDVNEERSSSDE